MKKIGVPLVILILFLIPFIPTSSSTYMVSFLFELLMWVAFSESWLLISGYTGYISLGHAVFFGLGAYTMVHLGQGLPYALIIILSGLTSGLFALLIGYPFLRVRGPYFVILTLGLTKLCQHAFISIEIKVSGTLERALSGGPSMIVYYYSILIIALGAIATAYLIKNSKFGMGLLSIKEDEDASESLGINTTLYKLLAFGISSFFPGMVGAVAAMRRSYVSPDSVFDPMVSFMVVTMALFGGWTRIEGVLLGVILLSFLFELLSVNYPYYYMILTGVIVILVVKFMPGGLFGIKEKVAAMKILRRA